LTGIQVNGSTLTISAAFGTANGQVVLLESDSLTTPRNQWVPVLTNHFDASGNLDVSANVIDPGASRKFYMLSQ
jgi:hypothetical protein